MANRFGRNQRRKMRERIGNLEEAIFMDRALQKRQRAMIDDLAQELANARRITNNLAVIFEASDRPMQLSGPARREIQVMKQLQLKPSSIDSWGEHAGVEQLPLPVMVAELDQDKLAGAIHTRVRFGDGQWGYAVSELAIQAMPFDVLVERLTKELAHQIAHDLKSMPGVRA